MTREVARRDGRVGIDAGGETTDAGRIALEILGRAPVELSRRASYGQEERIESVLVRWRDGRIYRLEQARDDRISFALRDRYESAAPSCRDQLARLVTRHGAPESVTVAWRYLADWEGTPPVRQSGHLRFAWREAAAILALPVAGCAS